MKRLLNDPAFMFMLLVAACFLFAAFPAYAGGDDIRVTQSNDMNNQTGGDISIGGDRGGRALAWSMGDVDIGECLAHKGTLVYTWPTENVFCQAQWLIAAGYVEAGEHLMCRKTKIAKLYDDYDSCRAGLKRSQAEPPLVPQPAQTEDVDEERYVAQQIAIDSLTEQLAMLERRKPPPAPKPRVIERTVVEQKPLLTPEIADSLRIQK